MFVLPKIEFRILEHGIYSKISIHNRRTLVKHLRGNIILLLHMKFLYFGVQLKPNEE